MSTNTFLFISQSKVQRSAITDDSQLWTSPVPYVLDDSLGKSNLLSMIALNICSIKWRSRPMRCVLQVFAVLKKLWKVCYGHQPVQFS